MEAGKGAPAPTNTWSPSVESPLRLLVTVPVSAEACGLVLEDSITTTVPAESGEDAVQDRELSESLTVRSLKNPESVKNKDSPGEMSRQTTKEMASSASERKPRIWRSPGRKAAGEGRAGKRRRRRSRGEEDFMG